KAKAKLHAGNRRVAALVMIALSGITAFAARLIPNAGHESESIHVVDATSASTIPVISIARSGPDVVVTFQAVQGVTYRLERKLNITDATWQIIPSVGDITAGVAGPTQFTDSNAIS